MDPLKDFLTSDSLRAHDILKYVKAFAKTSKQTNEQINQKNAEVLKVQSSVDLTGDYNPIIPYLLQTPRSQSTPGLFQPWQSPFFQSR